MGLNAGEYVRSEELFNYVWRTFPDMTNVELANMLGKHEKSIRQYQQQEKIRLSTADEILTKLDMNYLLSSGEIEVVTVRQQPPPADVKQLKKDLTNARTQIGRLKDSRDYYREQRDYWRDEAGRLKALLDG